LLEGWCIGASPESEAALAKPINALETQEDPDGSWRRYVNRQLSGPYAELFSRLHCLVMLQAPSLARVLEWRCLQEQKLAQRRRGAGVMDPAQIKRFVEHYERVTRHCLEEMPARADYLLEVGDDHGICGAHCR
jgi:D-glycerate 3-kinase